MSSFVLTTSLDSSRHETINIYLKQPENIPSILNLHSFSKSLYHEIFHHKTFDPCFVPLKFNSSNLLVFLHFQTTAGLAGNFLNAARLWYGMCSCPNITVKFFFSLHQKPNLQLVDNGTIVFPYKKISLELVLLRVI